MPNVDKMRELGKEEYLKRNSKQMCENPFRNPNDKWSTTHLEFEIYLDEQKKKCYRINTSWIGKFLGANIVTDADGEFAVKYGLKSYLVWQTLNYLEKQEVLEIHEEYLWRTLRKCENRSDEKTKFIHDVREMRNALYEYGYGSEKDTFGSIEYTDENRDFVIKYGDTNWRIWEGLTEKEKAEYEKYEDSHKSMQCNYETLFSEWIDSKRELERLEAERKAELERIEYEKRMEKFRFNMRNAHVRDADIKLRQYDHVYIVNGVALDSVTTFVDNAFPQFDAAYHAKRKAEQLGVSVKEVLEMWEKKGQASRDLGTAMHTYIENYYLGEDIEEYEEETAEYKLFKVFASKMQLNPYRTEWSVYDWEHKIAGTIDFVDYQNGEYVIYDWKRSDKIVENGMPVKANKYGEKGKNPLEHLDNTPYYHYALQLSLYKYILEKNYGLKIADLRLGIFHPTYNKPYVLRMPYLEKEVNDIIALRSEILF